MAIRGRLYHPERMQPPVCAIVGVGPGNGAAMARAMSAEGHAVALLARDRDYLAKLAEDIDGAGGRALAQPCDAADEASVTSAFAAVKEALGPVDVLLYNAGSGHFGGVEDVSAKDMEQTWRVNCLGLFLCARQVLPDMKQRGAGTIVVSGATASLRGGARFAAFAAAKAAQRSLAQSMARQLGPQGIHVAHVVIDGVIDLPRTRGAFPNQPDTFFLSPAHIAEAVVFLVKQPRSAWTFELDVRPFAEKW
jgi:NAD(P)-dependent dehydrogenase (short-subunit alcohol dehydrogenase family)